MKRLAFALLFLLLSRPAFARKCAVAQGDAQKVIDVTTTSGSGNIVSATANWQAGDVGKRIFVVTGGGGAATTVIAVTTISARADASHITTTLTAGSSTTGSVAVWGTAGMAAAITTQVTACLAGTSSTFPSPTSGPAIGSEAGIVTVSGHYMVSGCIYDVEQAGGYAIPSLIGDGPGSTVFYAEPVMTACAGSPQLIIARGAEAQFSGFSVDASYIQYASGGLVSIYNSQDIVIGDLNVYNWGTLSSSSIAFSATGNDRLYVNRMRVQNSPTGSLDTGCQFGGAAEIHSLFCSNHFQNITFAGNIIGPANLSLQFYGGGSDECSDPYQHCTIIQANTGLETIGSTFFGEILTNAGSILTIENGNVGGWSTDDRMNAIYINATAKVYSMHTRWRGQGGAMSVNNQSPNGFVDMLGNTFPSCTSGGICTERSPGKAFTGYQPITR